MRSLVPLLMLLATGCASTLSTLQTARPLARGQVQASGGLGFFVPVGPLATVVQEGIAQGLAARRALDSPEPYHLAEADAQKLLSAGLALAVAPPGATHELMLRAGLLATHDLDVGLRLSSTSLRFDIKARLAHGGYSEDPSRREGPRVSRDVALGLGLSRHLFRGPVLEVLRVVELGEFSRWDLEVPLYLSVDFQDAFKLYAAPKYIYSRTRMDARLVASSRQGTEVSGFDVRLPAQVGNHFYGASVGLALGYRYVHLYAELTAGYSHCRPVLFGAPRDLGGFTLYPAVGLAFKNLGPLSTSPGNPANRP